MSEIMEQINLPEWADGTGFAQYSTIKLPFPPDESFNKINHPHLTNCKLFWAVGDERNEPECFVGISNIDVKNRHAEIHITGKTSAEEFITEAAKRMCKHCFDTLNLNRVHVMVAIENNLSEILKKIGFKLEATLRKHFFADGKYHDVHWFGYLKSDREEEI